MTWTYYKTTSHFIRYDGLSWQYHDPNCGWRGVYFTHNPLDGYVIKLSPIEIAMHGINDSAEI